MDNALITIEGTISTCSNCAQALYNYSTTCPSCFAPIESRKSEIAAIEKDIHEPDNPLLDKAKSIRNMTGLLWFIFAAFFALVQTDIIFILPLVIMRIFFITISVITVIVIPICSAHWLTKYTSSATSDQTLKPAKINMVIALLLWLPILAIDLSLLSFVVSRFMS